MVLLPYDCVKAFLENHALVNEAKVSPQSVHECIVQMLDATKVPERGGGGEPSSSIGPCIHCKERRREIDIREALIVCTNCGVVEKYSNPRNCMAFDKSEPTTRTCRDKKDNLPQWIKNASQFDDGEYHAYEVGEEVEHWNTHRNGGTHMGEDDLSLAKKRALIPVRASITSRSLAALFFPWVKSNFDFENLNQLIRQGKTLPILKEREDPNLKQWGELRCLRCDAIVSTPYEQKRHPCNWGKTKRRRVAMSVHDTNKFPTVKLDGSERLLQ